MNLVELYFGFEIQSINVMVIKGILGVLDTKQRNTKYGIYVKMQMSPLHWKEKLHMDLL